MENDKGCRVEIERTMRTTRTGTAERCESDELDQSQKKEKAFATSQRWATPTKRKSTSSTEWIL